MTFPRRLTYHAVEMCAENPDAELPGSQAQGSAKMRHSESGLTVGVGTVTLRLRRQDR